MYVRIVDNSIIQVSKQIIEKEIGIVIYTDMNIGEILALKHMKHKGHKINILSYLKKLNNDKDLT